MMPFVRLDAVAAPLPMENVDTDQILAARYLKTTTKTGLGAGLFSTLRARPDFVLNHAPWDRAGILVSLDNFGCGSSREHAPWALLDFGIRCVIAPSIADIFYNNCFKNGILPIVLEACDVARLMRLASVADTARMVVDLKAQSIETVEGRGVTFRIDPRRKQDLLAGVDEVARTLSLQEAIDAYEARRDVARPWTRPIENAV
jgi:3-isopropylmalate/(R)-2-methylmalate dehydratase small subunit